MDTNTQSSDIFIGVDLAGTTLRAAIVTGEGKSVAWREIPLNREAIVEQIGRTVNDLKEGAPGVLAVGVGIPGLVDRERDRIITSVDFPSMVDLDVQKELAKLTGLRVEIENDANAAAFGEFMVGAGRGSRNMFYAAIGDLIGGAIIIDSKLWFGASGLAGEFGHITIDAEGIECACGNTGCLETVASAPNIVRRTHDRLYRDNTSSLSKLSINQEFTAADIAREAHAGDDLAAMMIERTGKFIGTAIAAVINLLNLERIVLGGLVMEAGDLILTPIIREAGRRSFQPCFDATQIVAGNLGSDAVAIGAALLAKQSCLD